MCEGGSVRAHCEPFLGSAGVSRAGSMDSRLLLLPLCWLPMLRAWWPLPPAHEPGTRTVGAARRARYVVDLDPHSAERAGGARADARAVERPPIQWELGSGDRARPCGKRRRRRPGVCADGVLDGRSNNSLPTQQGKHL